LRFRPGPSNSGLNAQLNDCFDIWSGENIIIDHCSFTWGEDENFTIWSINSQPKKITIQKSIIGSGLRKQGTAQGYGLLIGGQFGADEVTIADNLFIHNMQRNPLLNGKQTTRTVMYNNVIYNYGYFGSVATESAQLDLLSNYYKSGNNTTTARYEVLINQQALLYSEGNIGLHRTNNLLPEWDIVGFSGTIPPQDYCTSPAPTTYQSLNPFSPTPSAISTANQTYNDLIASQDVGANFKLDDSGSGAYVNNIDAIDAALILDLINDTGQPVYDTDIGTTVNYPFLNPGTAPTDSDNDGMPDVWENACGLNPGNPNDRNNIASNGYTNLENYLNNVTCGVINPPVTCTISVWLEGAFDMNTLQLNNTLQQVGKLPSGQPYNTVPWNYYGTEGAGWQQSDYPAGAIDWVLISLRTTPHACTEVVKVAALLMDDGTILPASIDLTGNSATTFYIVVEHRNHIPVMTPTAIPLVNNTLSYDFRTANSYNAGTGFGQTQLGTQWAMFAGDISQDSPVGYEISGADLILRQAANGNFSDYLSEDTNLDGDVNGMDRILLNLNNGIASSVKKCTNSGNTLGCSNAGVNGDLSVQVPLPPGGAYWDSTSPYWSVTKAGSPFNFTPYLGTGPFAFSLNGLPDGNYCANFEGTPLDANGNPLPVEYAQCCFVVD